MGDGDRARIMRPFFAPLFRCIWVVNGSLAWIDYEHHSWSIVVPICFTLVALLFALMPDDA